MEDTAASGGYWLACAGEKIYVCKSSVVGSIGVIAATFGLKELISRYGIERRVYTAGTSRLIMDPFRDVTEKDEVILKRTLLQIHENFKEHVRQSRKDRLKASEDVLFTVNFGLDSKPST